MEWMSPLFNWLTFFSPGGERNERESNDKTLVADKPDQGERPRRPKAFYWIILPTAEKLTFQERLSCYSHRWS